MAGCSQQNGEVETTAPTTENITTEAPTTQPKTTQPPTTAEPTTAVTQVYDEGAGQATLYSNSNVLNVMIFGTDGNSNSGRSDSMMLVSLDKNHGKIKLTSFLRDTYVTIPGYSSNKLNAAYAYGGPEFAVETIEYNFGVKIDAYVIVNFSTFKSIINSLGGVDVELEDREILYINAQIAQNGQSQYLPEGTSAGTVHLNGQQALWHVRNRGGYVNGIDFWGSDWDRVDRQQKTLSSIMQGIRNASYGEVSDVVYNALPYITTTMSSSLISELVSNADTYLGYSLERTSVPTDDTWEYDYFDHAGSVIYVKDWETLRSDVARFVFEDVG